MAKRKSNKKLSLPTIIILLVALVISGIMEVTGTWDRLNASVTDSPYIDIRDLEDSDIMATANFIDVGQGDSTLFVSKGESMLIDSGEAENADVVINALTESGITELDYIVATHAHSDHIGAMAEILSEVPAKKVLISKPSEDSQATWTFNNFIDAVEECDAELIVAESGYEFAMGYALCRILSPINFYSSSENNNSIIMHISVGSTSFMMTGDAESGAEKTLLDRYDNIDAQILKVGHHGSNTSSTEDFIDEVNPEVAVIHVGKDNKYGHPADVILERISQYTDDIYTTCDNGTVTVTCYKDSYEVSTRR